MGRRSRMQTPFGSPVLEGSVWHGQTTHGASAPTSPRSRTVATRRQRANAAREANARAAFTGALSTLNQQSQRRRERYAAHAQRSGKSPKDRTRSGRNRFASRSSVCAHARNAPHQCPEQEAQGMAPSEGAQFDGVADGTRTHDNWNHNPGLYQLSYSHHLKLSMTRVHRGCTWRARQESNL